MKYAPEAAAMSSDMIAQLLWETMEQFFKGIDPDSSKRIRGHHLPPAFCQMWVDNHYELLGSIAYFDTSVDYLEEFYHDGLAVFMTFIECRSTDAPIH